MAKGGIRKFKKRKRPTYRVKKLGIFMKILKKVLT